MAATDEAGSDDGTRSDDTVQHLLLERLGPEFSAHPQPYYRRLREQAPVLRIGPSVTLSRHDDVEYALRHPEIFSSRMEGVFLGDTRPLIPLQIDPPEHKKYRKLLDPLFAPREVAKLERDVVALTNELIDAFIDRGECDYNTELAVPLPTTVFLRLLGLPIEDRTLFLRFKDEIIRPGDGTDLASEGKVRQATAQEMYAYFDAVLDEREKDRRDDLLSGFLDARVDGEELTRDDILDICFLLLIAGLDTVTDALDCSMAYLAQHPDQRDRLVTDPAMVPAAVEELLRWETPVPGVARVTARDVEIAGCPVHAGDTVSVLIGSANCDERSWVDAYDVDLTRDPNRHLAFGGGVHRCLGSHLARLELRVALQEWHRRIPRYRVRDGVELEYTPALRQVEYLPLVIGG